MLRDPKKEAEVLHRAVENNEVLRLELNGEALLTFSAKGHLRILATDHASLLKAGDLLVEALQEMKAQMTERENRMSLLNMALGAIMSRLEEVPKPLAQEDRPLKAGDGSVTFAQAPPKGKAS